MNNFSFILACGKKYNKRKTLLNKSFFLHITYAAKKNNHKNNTVTIET